jgi:hypothetical protein
VAVTAPFLDMVFARSAAESLMTSTCTISRPGGESVTDPTTGAVTFPDAVVWSGPCRVRQPGMWGRTSEAGGEQISPTTFRITIPFAVVNVQRGDRVTITASDDPMLVGRSFEVRFTPDMGAHITARRLLCEEV